jgi:hypothetical protein
LIHARDQCLSSVQSKSVEARSIIDGIFEKEKREEDDDLKPWYLWKHAIKERERERDKIKYLQLDLKSVLL